MKTGFIGAGKVGCSLGKLLAIRGAEVTGYYDRDTKAAEEAAQFTESARYESAGKLAEACDVLFITVPDGLIRPVFQDLLRGCGSNGAGAGQEMAAPASAGTGTVGGEQDREADDRCDGAGAGQDKPASGEALAPDTAAGLLRGKLICHCSGSLSSQEVFAGAAEAGAFAYSVHPLFAVSSRFETYRELGGAYFTLEGDPDRLEDMCDFLAKAGLTFRTIDPASKTRYHLAAVYASNLILALLEQSNQLLQECGFGAEEAMKALAPLIRGNVEHAIEAGPAEALTGPVERGDLATLKRHLGVCDIQTDRELYLLLSEKLLQLARQKHPEREYRELERFLRGDPEGSSEE